MSALPLAVDLDGTLTEGDLFARAMARFCFAAPWHALILLAWLTRGRAYAKARLETRYPTNAAALPYKSAVLAWLREEHASGRVIVLATAYDRRAADAIAAHLGLFERVFASDGRVNLKSRRKAEALAAAFPEGFAYAGNERADLAVWRAARAAILVDPPRWLLQRALASFNVECVFLRSDGP